MARHKLPQVVLNGLLVLRGRRDDLRIEEDAGVVQGIPMIERPSRRFRAGVTRSGMRRDLHGGSVRHLVVFNDPQRLFAGLQGLYAPYQNAPEWITADRA